MTFDIDYQEDAEEVVIVIDNHLTVRANQGNREGEIVYCKKFRGLADEDEELFNTLKFIVAKLFAMNS